MVFTGARGVVSAALGCAGSAGLGAGWEPERMPELGRVVQRWDGAAQTRWERVWCELLRGGRRSPGWGPRAALAASPWWLFKAICAQLCYFEIKFVNTFNLELHQSPSDGSNCDLLKD